MSTRNLSARERTLLNLYTNCRLSLSPSEFYTKWNVTHALMAQICNCSESTVDRWFQHGKSHQPPSPIYLRRLAEIDFLWEHYEQFPSELRQKICEVDRNQTS
jgi:hypothetical protein